MVVKKRKARKWSRLSFFIFESLIKYGVTIVKIKPLTTIKLKYKIMWTKPTLGLKDSKKDRFVQK